MGTVAKFKYKGNIYSYEGVCRFKIGDSWVDAVMYSKDNHMYVREILDFIVKFECIEAINPLPGGDVYLKKQKTVTEMVQDQLGSGYVPRGHEGGRQILVKEIEDGPVVADKEYDDQDAKEPWSDNRPRVSIEPDLTIH